MGDENKQFEASQQKLRKAREQGQVVKSKDLSTAIAIIIMFSVIYLLGPMIWGQLSALFVQIYEQIPNKHLEDIGYPYLFIKTFLPAGIITLPILVLASFVGVLGDMIQIGPLFTTKPMEFNAEKFNPTKYFKNLASPKTLFDLFKNIAKVVILGIIAYIVYSSHFEDILMLAAIDNDFAILIQFGSIILDFIIKAGIAFLIIAAADYGVTKWKFLQDQKMSFKEVKDEYKNSEGDPNVKAALRQRRMQLLQGKMMDAVTTCDFVVTNPTHVACAIKYDAQTMESPMLVAKGTELFAQKIKQIAREHNIPVIENPPVARALFRFVEVNRQIPPDLYKAIAEILIFVYKLKKTTAKEQTKIQKAALEKGDVQAASELQKKREKSLEKFKEPEQGET
ncbi:MAG: EscU/YscU/HrcU family type III secretion system export apparatus switch protein [Candidatus Gastranaerophilales bacterium]|nr:EscU/YscU/HrcU family type III secretion system export apparatus switch protein [Candidatus Gastranaerophilales bacterium]